jgi:two-component system response regulator HydG
VNESLKILVIDDEKDHAEVVAETLERKGYQCATAFGGRQGMEIIEQGDVDLVITDLVMPDVDGMEVLRRARDLVGDIEVIMMTGKDETVKTAVKAMQEGAAHYLLKPLDMNELRAVVAKVAEKQQLARENLRLRQQVDKKFGFTGIIANNPQMLRILEITRQIAPTSVRVLIIGETGTGKELIARAIHNTGPRRNRPFVALNCAALSRDILESELFGHLKGAFTGAIANRKGLFEHAHLGTLLLDEVADIPISTQVKLLRFIEFGEIKRVGSNVPTEVDVRLLSASNRDLEEEVEKGSFRHDLYMRLKGVTIELPPLRDRPEDIPLMIDSFIKEFSEKYNVKIKEITEDARRLLCSYPWPGNVRELKNCIENMVVLARAEVLGVQDIPGDILTKEGVAPRADSGGLVPGMSLEEAEKELIRKTLAMTKGNREEAARILHIGERTLYRKLKRFNLS